MNIKRMLLLASMSLAAIAFAAPAVAQGNVFLTEPAGTKLKVGAKVTATSENLKTTTEEGTLECKLVTLHYEVLVNGENHVVLNPVIGPGETHNGTTQECTVSGFFPAHITNAGTKQLTIDTWGFGTVSSTFTSEVTTPEGTRHCSYSGNVSIQGQESGGDLASVVPSKLLAPEEGCKEGTIHGTVTLETPNGVPVGLDFVETP